MEKIVIVGGGQASAWAAQTLRKEGFEGAIHVVSNEKDIFYERPPLSKQNLLEEMDSEALSFFPQEAVESWHLNLHLNCNATAIDTNIQIVYLDSGESLSYDKLLLATGSSARVLNPAWHELDGVYTLRNLEQSHLLREKLKGIKRLVVIGGGWIGLEVAASAAQLGLQVTVLEVGPHVCGRSISPEISELLHAIHREEGVDIMTLCGTIELQQAADGGVEIHLDHKLWEIADIVLVAAGAQINTALAKEAGLDVSDGIVVNEYCQSSHDNIYAAGDVAIHPELGFSMQSWAHAQNQGIAAAKHMLGKEEPYKDIPWLWSDQYDCNIQILGTPIMGGKRVIRDSGARKKSYFYFDENDVLRYVVAVNEPRNIKIAKRWMQRQTNLDLQAISDVDVNLMTIK